jgi:ATP-dependent DNA helicase RecQ
MVKPLEETRTMPPQSPANTLDGLKRVIERHWGYRTFRPLQEQAMRAVLDGRDSVVVLPTGGGKSLCYQAPAVLRGDTTVVISPLIALMKDQVDNLQANGVAAIQIDSSQTPEERYHYEQDIRQGAIRLLFVSPERLVNTDFYQLLARINVRTFAIDEAHCISHWGHDFRPEYRQLGRIKELFPGASVHAYTATATEQVRRDICAQLGLSDPEVLVGNFDRPNLTYRVLPRHDRTKQVLEVLERHPGDPGIIYAPFQRDVEDLTSILQQHGYDARRYHAGLSSDERRATQDAFAAEQCNLIVATVAFGMGIDRSNIRFILHTAMPKSLEHYQQETGRAGRDGEDAECILLHSGADLMTWKAILEKNAEEAKAEPAFLTNVLKHLDDIDRFCRGVVCRHRSLVEYFGQGYATENCGACDLCLGDTQELEDALVVAQKILSCVARVRERFGIGHVINVLRGRADERVLKFSHDKLSTFGLLRDRREVDIRDWIYQLLSQKVLRQNDVRLPSGDTVQVLGLNGASWEVMKGQREVRLLQLVRRKKGEKAARSKAEEASWEGVDRGLFEELRGLRRKLAQERGCQPYMVFSDNTLRELARVRPSTLARMHHVYGVGEAKLRDYGQTFLDLIAGHCASHGLTRDNAQAPPARVEEPRKPAAARPNAQRALAFEQFREGAAVEDVMHQTGRARTTVVDYLCEYIREERPRTLRAWVPEAVYDRVAQAARQAGTDRLKPIFLQLGEQVSYDEIRLVLAHLTAGQNRAIPPAAP